MLASRQEPSLPLDRSPMKHILPIALAMLAVMGCTNQSPEASSETEGAESSDYWPWQYRDEVAADFDAHRAAMAGPWPVEATSSTCRGDCFVGVLIAGSLYATYGPLTLRPDQVGGLVATYNGYDIHAIDGLDPAVYLAMDSPEGLQLIEYWRVPWEPVSRETAVSNKAARCAVTEIMPRDEIFTQICRDPNIAWYSAEWAPAWLTGHPELRVGDPTVFNLELAESVADQVEAARASDPPATVVGQTESGQIPFRTYPSVDEALPLLLQQACATGRPCRSGYRIEAQSPSQVSLTITTQQVDPRSQNGILVGYSSMTLTQARPTVWWVSASGPVGGYNNTAGSATREQADQLFTTCCQATSGQL